MVLTFKLEVINSIGKIIESEESDELNIKVYIWNSR